MPLLTEFAVLLTPDLPPLDLLPTFALAARLGSFKAAAEALHLSPSAVSQQIKALGGCFG